MSSPLPQPRFAVISDEIATSLDDVIEFAVAERLDGIEVRQIEGANFLSLTAPALEQAARRLSDAGVAVTGLATPLFKWPAPGQPDGVRGDQFGFDHHARSTLDHCRHACEAASILGTKSLRIFSYLTHDGFTTTELRHDLDGLLKLAEAHDLVLMLENEPVCNIRHVAALRAMVEAYDHPRLRALLDIGNAHAIGERPGVAEVAALMPWVDLMHIKDYVAAAGKFVVLGEGDIAYRDYLAACLEAAGGRRLTLSLETHVPLDRREATRRSLAALRGIVATLTD